MPDMRILRLFLIIFLLLGAGLASAQDDTDNPDVTLAAARTQIASIRTALKGDVEATQLDDFRTSALEAQANAKKVATALQPVADAAKARLSQLGPAPASGAPAESADLAKQRKDSDKALNDVTAKIKQANLTALDGQQLATTLAEMRRDRFQASLARRTSSPLSVAFWTDPNHSFPSDRARLKQLASDTVDDLRLALQPGNRVPFFIFVALGLALIVIRRWQVEKIVLRLTTNRVPAGRLRRSAMAVAITVVTTLTIGFSAELFYVAANWNDTLSDDVAELGQAMVRLVFFGAFVAGLGRALLSPGRPSWRLPAISDTAAERLRQLPLILSIAAVCLAFVAKVNSTVAASLSSTVVTSCLTALLISGLIGMCLVRLGRAHHGRTEDAEHARPLWMSLLITAAAITVVVIWLAVLLGYIAFASFAARQMLWTGIVIATLYLMMHFVDDLFETTLSAKSPMSQRAQAAFGMDPRTLDQLGALLSGVSRVMLFLFAIVIVFSRYGAGPSELLALTSKLDNLKLGTLTISPDKIGLATIVVLLGLVAVRILKSWLSDQLLPRTSLDDGMSSSLVTLFGYTGGIVVFAFALAALGLSVQNITWVASALSVGIGFGLQAIVQNFISGLIMLAERPVKVGDWVVLDGTEGDIRRINVRATEIQMGDRSTVIVPNSEFITKKVRNMTLSNPQGRVLIKLPMPLNTDTVKTRDLILEAFGAHPAMQSTPAPSVQLESVDANGVMFAASGYVASPRDAYGVRSDLLFDILGRLRAADIALVSPQDLVLRTVAADATKALNSTTDSPGPLPGVPA
jgi:potassium efflux system protein